MYLQEVKEKVSRGIFSIWSITALVQRISVEKNEKKRNEILSPWEDDAMCLLR